VYIRLLITIFFQTRNNKMSVTTTSTISNNITYTMIDNGSNSQTETAGLGYSQSLTNGEGSLQANYGVVISGALPSGGKEYLDFRSLTKTVFNADTTIQFSKIKSIVIENRATAYANDITVAASGANALTELFNGGSGNVRVKPYAVYQYSDPISGVTVDATNKDLRIDDVDGSGG
jgi:hypothetical protein